MNEKPRLEPEGSHESLNLPQRALTMAKLYENLQLGRPFWGQGPQREGPNQGAQVVQPAQTERSPLEVLELLLKADPSEVSKKFEANFAVFQKESEIPERRALADKMVEEEKCKELARRCEDLKANIALAERKKNTEMESAFRTELHKVEEEIRHRKELLTSIECRLQEAREMRLRARIALDDLKWELARWKEKRASAEFQRKRNTLSKATDDWKLLLRGLQEEAVIDAANGKASVDVKGRDFGLEIERYKIEEKRRNGESR